MKIVLIEIKIGAKIHPTTCAWRRVSVLRSGQGLPTASLALPSVTQHWHIVVLRLIHFRISNPKTASPTPITVFTHNRENG